MESGATHYRLISVGEALSADWMVVWATVLGALAAFLVLGYTVLQSRKLERQARARELAARAAILALVSPELRQLPQLWRICASILREILNDSSGVPELPRIRAVAETLERADIEHCKILRERVDALGVFSHGVALAIKSKEQLARQGEALANDVEVADATQAGFLNLKASKLADTLEKYANAVESWADGIEAEAEAYESVH